MTFRSPRPVPARLCLMAALAFVVAACGPIGGTPGAVQNGFNLPSTTKGVLAFSPVDGATELDPAQTSVVVRSVDSRATVRSVIIQPDGAPPLAGSMQNGQYRLDTGLRTDQHYTITAIAAVRDSAGNAADRTETSSFSTATTPRVVKTDPPSVGEGQSLVVALSPAASAIVVEGPVRGQLSSDGTQVTVVPGSYKQGQTYTFQLTAKNRRGIPGAPQEVTFTTPPRGTVDVSLAGMQNVGVALPLVLNLSADAGDRNDLVSRLALTADIKAPGTPGTGSCGAYGNNDAQAGPLAFTASWLSPRRLRLVPKTSDGYWPANSVITVSGKLSGYHLAAGSFFENDLTSSFNTGDKRVIDVDLSGQQLTACKNGSQAMQFLISSGVAPKHFTFTGTFFIYRRVADEEMKSPEGPFAPDYYDIKHVPWTQYFDGGAALHGAWWHNNFGHPMSHGCVNIQTATLNVKWPQAQEQAKALFDFDNLGDPVIVHGVTPGLSPAQQLSD